MASLRLCFTRPVVGALQGGARPAFTRIARPSPRGLRVKPIARAVETAQDDVVIIPWEEAEESWSEQSSARMEKLMARFKAADKDGCVRGVEYWGTHGCMP